MADDTIRIETIADRVYDRIKHAGLGDIGPRDFQLVVLGTIYALGEYADPAFDAITDETLKTLAKPLEKSLGVRADGSIRR